MIVSISFDTEAMPRLNLQQREQAICRLHAGQPARVIANDFNCNVRTIECLRVRYNATNSMNDRPRCGRSQVTTARQNRLMVRQYLRNRFTRATETARQTVWTHQRPMSADTVRHRLVASNLKCYRPAREPVLGVSSSGVTSSLVGFQRVWALIPVAFINRLVNTMYRRCAAVINAGGGHTRY
jgi:hypothetical protein